MPYFILKPLSGKYQGQNYPVRAESFQSACLKFYRMAFDNPRIKFIHPLIIKSTIEHIGIDNESSSVAESWLKWNQSQQQTSSNNLKKAI